jgi:hypothetical protein
MIYVTATFANGDTIKTAMNARPQQANAYYYGKYFNLGREGDNMQRCVSVFTTKETPCSMHEANQYKD